MRGKCVLKGRRGRAGVQKPLRVDANKPMEANCGMVGKLAGRAA